MLEPVDRIEPCHLDPVPPRTTDLLAAIAAAASKLTGPLHPATAASLANLVRVMNAYYSNLIEGHKTHPRDIERALNADWDTEPTRRNLQQEARAHIRVQQLVDESGLSTVEPAAVDYILWLHKQFYHDASPEMLLISEGERSFTMTPGAFRTLPEHDVEVGRHVPPSSDRVAAFMAHFATRYRFADLGPGQRILAIPAAHHRLNYIHPFPDGNGRVSRLMSHAMAHAAGIGAHGLWSISRGLARGIESRNEYKQMMDIADSPRKGDLDGRGNLSRAALEEFTEWFLKICLDQITYMGGLFDIDHLEGRLQDYVQQEPSLRSEAYHILSHLLVRGQMVRGDAPRITGLAERNARDVVAALSACGIIGSATPKGPISLRFPSHTAEILFPRLYPQS